MSDQPSISVIFPTFNRCEVIRQTLHHLIAQEYPQHLVQVLVCDNSTDETPEMVESVAAGAPIEIRLLRSAHSLPAVKRNEGLRAARGDLALFLNDDVWVVPSFLRAHADAHRRLARPAAVLGYVEQSRAMDRRPFIEWYQPFAYDRIADRAGGTVPFWFHWSMNLSLPREVMIDRNLVFHEDWANIGHEDVELGYRWTSAGYDVVYEPSASGEHFHPHTLASACRLQESVGRGLRDLDRLIPLPELHERYGLFSWKGSPKSVARGLARKALFNRFSAPPLVRYFDRRDFDSRMAQWTYWKLMLWHTGQGYRNAAPRQSVPTPTFDVSSRAGTA